MRISDWSSDVCSSDLFSTGASQAVAAMAPSPAVAVDVATVQSRTITEWHDYSGRLEAVDRVEIRPLVSGTLTDRKSVVWGTSVSVRVDLGGRRIFKKKHTLQHAIYIHTYYTIS